MLHVSEQNIRLLLLVGIVIIVRMPKMLSIKYIGILHFMYSVINFTANLYTFLSVT
jgi:hypothetical protein